MGPYKILVMIDLSQADERNWKIFQIICAGGCDESRDLERDMAVLGRDVILGDERLMVELN